MACKARRMPDRNRLERTFFQPEFIARFRWRRSNEFFATVALRLVRFVTNGAAFLSHSGVRPCSVREFNLAAGLRNDVDVFVMGKRDCEIRCCRLALW